MGIKKLVTAYQLIWHYYFVLCFYWGRDAVNKLESIKINNVLRSLFVGAYIFQISINDDKDEFIKVDKDEKVAKQIEHRASCFSCGLYCNAVIYGALLCLLLAQYTEYFNEDFSAIDTSSIPF